MEEVNHSLGTSIGPGAQRLIAVREPSDVGEARRQAADVAQILSFDATPAGHLALGITEAGMNIVKHADEGCMLIRALHYGPSPAIEVLALDRGKGIGNIAESLRDGYSTAGSPGTGLGALTRLTRDFQIVSLPGRGTALRFEVPAQRSQPLPRAAIAAGAVCVPKPGEVACGDAWVLLQERDAYVLMVVDGLGHGAEAAAAAHVAADITARHFNGLTPAALIERLHDGMRATRGAAAAVIALDPGRESGSTCGVGNISVAIRHAGVSRKLVSHNGIVGHQSRKIQEFGFAFPPGALLIAHSDGLDTRWRVEEYPGLDHAHPALIAAVLYRDHQRGRDDATVVVVRNAMESGR